MSSVVLIGDDNLLLLLLLLTYLKTVGHQSNATHQQSNRWCWTGAKLNAKATRCVHAREKLPAVTVDYSFAAVFQLIRKRVDERATYLAEISVKNGYDDDDDDVNVEGLLQGNQ